MGVNLSPFVEWRVLPHPGRLAVDGHNVLVGLLNSGGTRSAVVNMLYKVLRILELGVKPVIVFDGAPHKLKGKTAGSSRLVEAVKRVKEGLQLMGVPCVHAPGEAEAQAAHMAMKKVVDAAYTMDYDAFLFGAPLVVRGVGVEAAAGATLRSVLRKAGLTLPQLVDAAVLAGTDFNKGVKGVGVKTAVALVKRHGCLENVLEALNMPKSVFLEARKVFLHPAVADVKFFFTSPNRHALKRFLRENGVRGAERFVRRLAGVKLKQVRLGW